MSSAQSPASATSPWTAMRTPTLLDARDDYASVVAIECCRIDRSWRKSDTCGTSAACVPAAQRLWSYTNRGDYVRSLISKTISRGGDGVGVSRSPRPIQIINNTAPSKWRERIPAQGYISSQRVSRSVLAMAQRGAGGPTADVQPDLKPGHAYGVWTFRRPSARRRSQLAAAAAAAVLLYMEIIDRRQRPFNADIGRKWCICIEYLPLSIITWFDRSSNCRRF